MLLLAVGMFGHGCIALLGNMQEMKHDTHIMPDHGWQGRTSSSADEGQTMVGRSELGLAALLMRVRPWLAGVN